MNEKSFWEFAVESIKANLNIALITVADSSLSSPGKQGFKMLVREDNVYRGTIGGGIMEKQLIDYGLNLLSGKESKQVKRLQHSPKTDLEHSGLICGGFQSIIFSKLTKNNLVAVNDILENINGRKNGRLRLANDLFEYNKNTSNEKDFAFEYNNEENFTYEENIGLIDTAYIIGGGHVGLAVSQIMKFIGFYVVVFDHRQDIFTMNQNVYADEKIVTSYSDVAGFIKEGAKSYVVIVTPAHAGDKDALGAVAKMNLNYLGMMGSKRKIKTIFNNLVKEGIDKELLTKVHSPVGLEIEAETPEEIAISIAAEIIQIKHSNR